MARPTFTPPTITPQQAGWDANVNSSFDTLKTMIVRPFPLALVYKTSDPGGGVPQLSTLDPADYDKCVAMLTDPAAPATDGHMIYSDGSQWLYVKTLSVV